MNNIPNIITIIRLLGSFGLVFLNPKSLPFWGVYFSCGVSDMIDGVIARTFHVESRLGAVLDSMADLALVTCSLIKLLPIFDFPMWLIGLALLIVFIKIINQGISFLVCGRFCFPHTFMNKVTGFLLFITAPMMFWSLVPIYMASGIAMCAAVQEGYRINKGTAISE